MRTVGIMNVLYCCTLVFLSKVSNDTADKVNTKIINIFIEPLLTGFYNCFQTINDTHKIDYESTCVVSFFNKPIAYKKLEETGENY